jgi:hypothetical protein
LFPFLTETCTTQSILVDTCTVVLAEFVVIGDDQNVAVLDLPKALSLIFQDDRAFDDELLNAQVVNVTLHEPDQVNAGDSLNDTPDIGPGQDPTVERSGLVASLSVAAGTVVLALLFRKALKAAAGAPGGDKDELQSHDDTIPHSVAYHV